MVGRFAKEGVEAARLVLRPGAPNFEYLRNYGDMDVALDAAPYNGGTTTTEAMWQGVPVLTFNGDRWASRTSRTLLARTHLAEFVAADWDDYVARAVALATDPATPARLTRLRQTAREQLTAAPVCNVSGLAAEMEHLYLHHILQ